MQTWPWILMEAGLQTQTIASTSSFSLGMIRPLSVQQMRTDTLQSIARQNALKFSRNIIMPQSAVKKGPFQCTIGLLDLHLIRLPFDAQIGGTGAGVNGIAYLSVLQHSDRSCRPSLEAASMQSCMVFPGACLGRAQRIASASAFLP